MSGFWQVGFGKIFCRAWQELLLGAIMLAKPVGYEVWGALWLYGLYRDLGLYWVNGKENGSYYNVQVLGFMLLWVFLAGFLASVCSVLQKDMPCSNQSWSGLMNAPPPPPD